MRIWEVPTDRRSTSRHRTSANAIHWKEVSETRIVFELPNLGCVTVAPSDELASLVTAGKGLLQAVKTGDQPYW